MFLRSISPNNENYMDQGLFGMPRSNDEIDNDAQLVCSQLKLSDIPTIRDCSVRLYNVFKRANKDLDVSIELFLREPEVFIQRFWREVPGFGRVTANELRKLSEELRSESDTEPRNWQKVEDRHQNYGLSREDISEIFSAVPFPECVLAFPISVRLGNVLRANNYDKIKSLYPNLGEFITKGIPFSQNLDSYSNLGRKSVAEFNGIIEKIVLVLLQDLSERSVISSQAFDLAQTASELTLCKTERFPLVENNISEHALRYIDLNWEKVVLEGSANPLIKESLKAISKNPNQVLEVFLKKELGPRMFDVVSRRYGFFREHRQTLQEISEGYAITRERVRQLETKALKQCSTLSFRSLFAKYIELEIGMVLSQLLSDRGVVPRKDFKSFQKEIPGHLLFCSDVVFGGIDKLLNEHLRIIESNEELLGWCRPTGSDSEEEEFRKILQAEKDESRALPSRLRKYFESGKWPFTISGLAQAHRSYSTKEITDVLVNNFGAEIVGDNVPSIENISVKSRLILTLRDLGRPERLSVIRAHHNKLFGVDILEHAAGAVLGRLDESLIVERGTYGLYEHLSFSESEVVSIREYCHEKLLDYQCFVSAKILCKRLKEDVSHFASRLTGYIVLGVCQDDLRFSIRRGLMIGLAKDGFEEDFLSLTDTIHLVVSDHGPLSIAEIKAHIAETRDVLDVGVSIVLTNSPEIIRTSKSKYDNVDRVLGPAEVRTKLVNAIKLCLIDGACSVHVLNSRLAALGYTYDKVAVISFLNSLEEIEISESLVSLVDGGEDIAIYNKAFSDVFDVEDTMQSNRSKVRTLTKELGITHLADQDFRLAVPPKEWTVVRDEDVETNSIINEMMEEFDF